MKNNNKIPIIPHAVAQLIAAEHNETEDTLAYIIYIAYEGMLEPQSVADWICDNSELFAEAWLNGYQIKK